MATSVNYYWQGKVKWCKPHMPDPWGNWKTDFYPNPESLTQVKKLKETEAGINGIKNVIKKDEDGEYITLRKKQTKVIKGTPTGMKAPEVLDGSITLPDGSNPPLRDTYIGNGSDVTLKVRCYPHATPGGGKARALEWDAVRIDNLVPYEGKKSFDPETQKQVEGLSDVPKPKF